MGPVRCHPSPCRRAHQRRRQPRLVRRAATQRGGGVSDPFTTPRREPPMDARNQRYRLPHPVSGQEMLWTRSTTWAKTIADIQAIHKWEKRMVVKGVAARAEPYALAAATPIKDQDKPHRIAAEPKE